jgi:hypothetical protein
MISPQSMFYQKQVIADRAECYLNLYRMSKHHLQRLLTLIDRATPQRRNVYLLSHALTLSRSHALTFSRSHALTFSLSCSLTRTDAKDGVQRTKTDQASKDKNTSKDQQDKAKGTGDSTCKVKNGKYCGD